MTKTLHAQIPATSANVGSGFDAVGIALTLYNDIYFTEEPDKDTITVEVEGLGANTLPRDFNDNMVGQAMKAVAIKNRQPLPQRRHAGAWSMPSRRPAAWAAVRQPSSAASSSAMPDRR